MTTEVDLLTGVMIGPYWESELEYQCVPFRVPLPADCELIRVFDLEEDLDSPDLNVWNLRRLGRLERGAIKQIVPVPEHIAAQRVVLLDPWEFMPIIREPHVFLTADNRVYLNCADFQASHKAADAFLQQYREQFRKGNPLSESYWDPQNWWG